MKLGALKRRLLRHVRNVVLALRLRRTTEPRIVLGAGGICERGWIPTEVDQLNILSEDNWSSWIAPGMVRALLAEHVLEHLTEAEVECVARISFRFLQPGGHFRIAVPDGNHPDSAYLNAVRPGGNGPGAEDHKVLFTYRSLDEIFRHAGYDVSPLEYFDEAGKFHETLWDPADGMIHRSRRFDPRNQNGKLEYTSVILDAIKPR
jgi:predicted SAM-dependent methyltransferase